MSGQGCCKENVCVWGVKGRELGAAGNQRFCSRVSSAFRASPWPSAALPLQYPGFALSSHSRHQAGQKTASPSQSRGFPWPGAEPVMVTEMAQDLKARVRKVPTGAAQRTSS